MSGAVSGKGVSPRVVWVAAGCIAVVPLAVVAVAMYKNTLNFPYWDEWQFVQFFDAWKTGSLHWLDFAVQHNEHRPFFPRLLMLALASCSGWNVALENGASVVLAAVLAAALVAAARRQARASGARLPFWALPLFSALVFSWGQMENWVWGWQVQVLLCAVCAAGALLLLGEFSVSWGALAGAAGLAFVASFSFAGGLTVWIVGLPLAAAAPGLARERKIARGVVWGLLGILTWQLFLTGYKQPEVSPSMMTALKHPLLFGGYIVLYLGSPVSAYVSTPPWHGPALPAVSAAHFLPGMAGLALLAWAGRRVWKQGPEARVRMLPWAGLAGYGLLAAAMTSAGRAEFGLGHALTSRYITLGTMFWYGIAGMCALAWPAGSSGPVPVRRAVVGATVGLALMAGAQWSLLERNRPWEDICRWKRMGWESIRAGHEAKLFLDDLCDTPDRMHSEYLPTLRRLGACGLSAAPVKTPERAGVFVAEGKRFFEEGKWVPAGTYFETALALDPGNAEAKKCFDETVAKLKKK